MGVDQALVTQRPLAGVRVLDLSTLLPGPLATLMLAEAGADVVKIEQPGHGDEMRSYRPPLGEASANYAILNRDKRSYAADLKNPAHREQVLALASQAHVVVEQFRPGVAQRLGLGYQQVSDRNPGVVYCSITGYGQESQNARKAGHDLNYLAEMGLLGLVTDGAGKPQLPVTVLADIAGGSYPAVVNVLLALRRRDLTGSGCRLDISMTSNLQVMAYGYFATYQASGRPPHPSGELLIGASPRYQVYATADDRHIAVAALEQKFWERFTELIALPEHYVDERGQEPEVIDAVAQRLAQHPARHWRTVFDGEDVCTVVVATFEEAVTAGLIDTDSAERLVGDGFDVGALPSAVDPALRGEPRRVGYPSLRTLPDAADAIWPVR